MAGHCKKKRSCPSRESSDKTSGAPDRPRRHRPSAFNINVSNLILFNTEIPWLTPPWVPLFQLLAPLPFASHIFRFCVNTRMIAASPMGFGGCFVAKDLIHGEFFSLAAQPLIDHPEKLAGCIRFLKSMNRGECKKLSEVHKRISAKVDCIWGEADPFFPVADARTMFEMFPNKGEFVTIQKSQVAPVCGTP